jgi:DNA-binding IclR family transcriptional regulator
MSNDKVEAVERALAVLEAFHTERPMTLGEIAAATGFYKSTILRLAASLERFGYLVREKSGAFRLGPALWRLGSIYRGGFDLGEAIRPELRRLAETTGETASFYIREGRSRVCLFRRNSPPSPMAKGPKQRRRGNAAIAYRWASATRSSRPSQSLFSISPGSSGARFQSPG